jgi:uncharacterized membrane protein YfcA
MLIGGTMGIICEWMFLDGRSTQKTAFNRFAYIYVAVLIITGIAMLLQSVSEWKNKPDRQSLLKSVMMRRWMLYLPFHRIFVRARAEMSVIIPIFVGFLAGVLVASLGGGSNLFMVPVIAYLIGRISPVVNGTISIVGGVITMVIALVYARSGYHCDAGCMLLLFAGAALGSTMGIKLTYKIRRRYAYAIAVVAVFAMAARQVLKLVTGSFSGSDGSIGTFASIGLPAKWAHDDPIMYTVICLSAIIVAAFMYEKFLQKFFAKGKCNVGR